ncbi:methyltransferase domain-containing protein [Patescibacteria group bacterium]
MGVKNNNQEVFDIMAERYVIEDSHWGSDLDLIRFSLDKLKAKYKEVHYLDIGCSSGFHIHSIAEWYPEIEITGVDYCSKSLEKSKEKINQLKIKNISLEEIDITQDELPKNKYQLITFLNNGLGNIYKTGGNPEKIRKEIIKKIENSLTDNGILILSVYNIEKLETGKYGENLKIIQDLTDLEKGDLYVSYKVNKQEIPYYSHWFSEKELDEIVENTNLKRVFTERRLSRFLIKYKKK